MTTVLTKALASLGISLPRFAPRGVVSGFVPGNPYFGQPTTDFTLIPSGVITPERMREIVLRTPTAAAAVNAIVDYAAHVPLRIRNVDASVPRPPRQSMYVEQILNNPNAQDTGLHLRKALIRDLITLGQAAIEIEPDENGRPTNLYPLDMARLRTDFDKHGTILGHIMFDVNGTKIIGRDGSHTFLPDEVLLFRRTPVTYSATASSQITQLYVCAVIEDLMLAFISGRFTESNVPYGLLTMGDVSQQEIDIAVAKWNEQATSGHRIIISGDRGSKFFPFGYHLKDLEAKELLAEVRGKIMAILGVTMNELGESQDINKSNGYNLSYTFKKRAIEPVLVELCETLTEKLIHDRLGFMDLEVAYAEIDSRDELLQAQIDESYLRNGVWTFNQVRNRKGDPSTDGGDKPMVFTGTAWVPVDMVDDFARAQLDDLLAIYDQTQVTIQQAQVTLEQMKLQLAQMAEGGVDLDGDGAEDAPIQVKPTTLLSPPLIRSPQMPMKETTPDGSGSSTAKVKYPKAKPTTVLQPSPTGKSDIPTKPRGKVQTAERAGMRNNA